MVTASSFFAGLISNPTLRPTPNIVLKDWLETHEK